MDSVFLALNGTEVKEVIMDKLTKIIRESLEGSDKFSQNITYPLLKFRYHITLGAYPAIQLEGDLPVVATGEVTLIDETFKPEDIESTTTELLIEGSEVVDTPDKAREEAGLSLPKVAEGNGGVTVDKFDPPGPKTDVTFNNHPKIRAKK
jgi:hypothetical protein